MIAGNQKEPGNVPLEGLHIFGRGGRMLSFAFALEAGAGEFGNGRIGWGIVVTAGAVALKFCSEIALERAET